MSYRTVIFDLDGTLLNTLDDLANAVNYAMRACGWPERTVDEVCSFIGGGMANLVRRAMPDGLDDAAHAHALEVFKAWYAQHQSDLTAPYAGIEALLERLKAAGVQMAVLSNKSDANVKELCQLHFSRWIELAMGEVPGVRRKPAPDALLSVMEKTASQPGEVLYVGDSDVDVITAANAHVDCAAVTWGFRSEEVLRAAGAEHLFDTAEALGDFVLAGK